MSLFLVVLLLLVGAFCGWGCTYLWFRRAKVRAKIAEKVNAAVKKI